MRYRILHLLTLAGLGGTEAAVLSVIRRTDANHFRSEIAVLKGEGPMSARWREAGIPVTHMNVRREWSPRTLGKLSRLIRDGRYDVVTLYGVAVNVLGRLASRRVGQKNVIGVIRGISNERIVSRLRLWVDRVSFSLADCYVSNSQAIIDHLIEAGFPPEKLRLARTGLSTEPFDRAPSREEARRRMGIAGDARPVITCVGNLRPVKDHSLLLRACRALRDRGFDYLLLLAGSGPAEEMVRREVRDLGLLDQVRFLGERGDIPTVLAATDLFVLTSLWEGLPRSIMEAMASRLAVVSTDAGGVRELVLDGETGYVVSVGDVEALGGRMADLLSDPALCRAMGEAGFQRVKERFTEEQMVTAMEAIYREVLEASSSPPTSESTGTPNPRGLRGDFPS